MLIDSHCHLDFPDFADELPAVLVRAREAGVGAFVTIGTTVARHDVLRDLAERFEDVFFTVGTHPLQAAGEPDIQASTYAALSAHPRCVGIGEAGLDYHYDAVPRPLAARVFRTQIAAARMTGLPLVIHSRDADEDMAAILRKEMGQGPFAAVLHCYTGGASLARTGLELGLFISFSGVLTFKASDALRAIARDVPMDRLLVETDAPFLSPHPFRGKRNEPARVALTASVLAEVKGVPLPELARATTANARRLFSRMAAAEGAA